MSAPVSNVRPKPDRVLVDIADYVAKHGIKSAEAFNTARLCLMDTLGCGLEALEYPACTKLLGPLVPGTTIVKGARVPGTRFELDPVRRPSTSAPRSAGSISTTPGSPPSGGTLPTTWAASSPSPTGCRATARRLPCATCSPR